MRSIPGLPHTTHPISDSFLAAVASYRTALVIPDTNAELHDAGVAMLVGDNGARYPASSWMDFEHSEAT